MKYTCSLNKNGLAMSFSNYKDIVIPKNCVGFTQHAYDDFCATANERENIYSNLISGDSTLECLHDNK